MKEMLKEALQLEPNSEDAQMAEELLYTVVVNKLDEIEREGPLPLLREAREQGEAAGKKAPPPAASSGSPAEQAREVRRRWRELYGLDAGEDEKPEE